MINCAVAWAARDHEKEVKHMSKISVKFGNTPNRARFIAMFIFTVLAHRLATANPAPVDLGSASAFAVTAGGGIIVGGPADSTTITGDIGTYPTATITGPGNIALTGVNQADDAVTQAAKNYLNTAYNDAAGRSHGASYAGGFDLVGQTLDSGVYNDGSSLFLSGTLTLDAQGNSDAVWIFQTGTSFITSSDSKVILLGGAQANNVYWQVGSSATLGTSSELVGNLMALLDITANTGASVDGRLLALNGAVSLDNNTIAIPVGASGTATTPEPSILAILGSLVALACWIKRRPTSMNAAKLQS